MSIRASFTVTAIVAALVAGSAPASALGPLPWCFSTLPFEDVLVLWPITTGGGQRDGSGYDLAGGRTMSVNTFTQGATLTIGYTIYPQPGFDPVFAGGTINAITGSGPGECFSPGLLDCGDDFGQFTFQKIKCPSAKAAPRVLASPGKIMGKR